MTEPPVKPRWLRACLLVGLATVLAIVVWWPMFKHYPGTPIEDGHYFFYQIEISKAAIRQYRELPLWNPFDCRGIPMWDHPENITASPLFYLTLPFSAGVTLIVWNVAHAVVGFCGMWLLARSELRLSRAATFLASAAWAFGEVHNQYAGEHEAFVSFFYAPLLLLLWRRAERSWSYAVGTGLVLALMVYDGATYPLPLSVVMLGFETLTRLTTARRALRIAAAAGVVGLVAASVGASRLLPLADQLASHNRDMEDDWDKLTSWRMWADMYLLRSPNWRLHLAGQQYVLGEYHAYIGPLGLLLVVLGVLSAATETTWMLLVCGFMVVLMLGHFAPHAPWTVLHAHVPPFKSMRVVARFRLLLAMYLAAYMGFAVDRFPAIVRRLTGNVGLVGALRVALVGIGMFAAGDSAGLFTEILEVRFVDAPPARVVTEPRFHYGGANLSPDFANHPRQNHAYLGCRAVWVYNADAAVWTGDVPQARALSDDVVVVESRRTHNTFTVVVDARAEGEIVLNSAHERGWKTNVGTVFERAHMLAVRVPPGRHEVHLRYWPRRLTIGLVISAVGLLASLLFLARGRFARRSGPG